MSKLIVVTVHPVQQVAAEPGTLDQLTSKLRARLSERLEQPVPTNQLGSLWGWPLVPDATLPPGYVYLRPDPSRPQPDEQIEGVTGQ
ncbi:hypothetical protein ACWD25_42235 [Streptomyces sp. NPDC002920]